MNIVGINKLTLLDYPGLTACTLFTGGCNFRCPFCHNASLVLDNSLPRIEEKEIFDFLEKRKNVLQGVCITGGEPTLNFDLDLFIEKIKKIGYKVKLDTNGNKPEVISHLLSNKLIDYIAMDIKNSLDKYAETVGIKNFNTFNIEKSAEILLSAKIDYEFRTTVVKEFHTEEDFKKIGTWLSGGKAYYLQQFVDSGKLIGDNINAYNKEKLQEFLQILKPFFSISGIRGI